jgi:hypothetical protein
MLITAYPTLGSTKYHSAAYKYYAANAEAIFLVACDPSMNEL